MHHLEHDDSLIEEFDFSELAATDADLDRDSKATKNQKQYPCGQCGGTGVYSGARVHQPKSHCFACKGKGYFLSSSEDRRKTREAARQRKLTQVNEGIQTFKAEHPRLVAAFVQTEERNRLGLSFNEFFFSLHQQLIGKGSLTQNQINAAYRSIERQIARDEERAAAKAKLVAEAPSVDLDPIKHMFDAAVESGYKKPKYRAEGLCLTRAPDTGRNPGALYITLDENADYLGKIIDGKFFASREGERHEAQKRLLVIAENPREAAVRYGQRTGRCSCCGRTLTNHASIDAGIGPICAEKWGL